MIDKTIYSVDDFCSLLLSFLVIPLRLDPMIILSCLAFYLWWLCLSVLFLDFRFIYRPKY
ncbi:hypothetical protein AtNW77_Chr3g0192441 [Arabidopsis thaliana]